jgi:hypothetical protein
VCPAAHDACSLADTEAIWLIEYDDDFQNAAATRLPVPVIILHVVLAAGGLGIWALYLITDADKLAQAAVIILIVVAVPGLVMAARWIPVRRAVVAARTGAHPVSPEFDQLAERNFPLPVVIAHGRHRTCLRRHHLDFTSLSGACYEVEADLPQPFRGGGVAGGRAGGLRLAADEVGAGNAFDLGRGG